MNTLRRLWDDALYYFGIYFTLVTIFYAFAGSTDEVFRSFVSAMLCFIMHRLDVITKVTFEEEIE